MRVEWTRRGEARVAWDIPAFGLTEAEARALQASALTECPSCRRLVYAAEHFVRPFGVCAARRRRVLDVALLVLSLSFLALVLSLTGCAPAARTGIAGARSEVTRTDRTTVRINLPPPPAAEGGRR